MAEDQGQKTEQATPRRRQKAREEGQVASSRDFTTAVQFGIAVLLLALWGGQAVAALEQGMRGLFAEAFRGALTVERLRALVVDVGLEPLSFLWKFAVILVAAGVLMQLVQTSFAFTPKRLAPDFGRLNPIPKLKDLPGENFSQLLKGLLLLPVAGLVFWYVLDDELPGFLLLPNQPVERGAQSVGDALVALLEKAAVILLLVGLFDFARQRAKLSKKLRMSKQEIRQEQKDLEGNPHIKARLRRLQREFLRRRMMSQVPKASVVITNPQHYAVALRYNPGDNPAPVVVAKGLDHMALRIRAVAEEHGVPLVENPPLAQALYKSAEIGSEIPPNLYRAVAEILAYIFRLAQT